MGSAHSANNHWDSEKDQILQQLNELLRLHDKLIQRAIFLLQVIESVSVRLYVCVCAYLSLHMCVQSCRGIFQSAIHIRTWSSMEVLLPD